MSSSLVTPDAPGLPAFSRTFSAFRQRVIGLEPTDRQYLDSFAEQLSDLGGHCRWAPAGSALRKWEGEDPKDGLRHRVDELVDEHEGEIYRGRSVRSDATTRHCWMLGSDKAHARPTVVISHNDQAILKRTMRVIIKSKTLKVNGFELKGCPNCDLELLTAGSKATLVEHADALGQSLLISLCGAEIEVKYPVRSATLGGVIILDGTYYGVTVAHAFTESSQATKGKLGTNVMLFDSDWAELSSGDESVGHGDAGQYWSPPSSVSNTHKKTSHPAMACAIRSSRSLIRHDTGNFPVAYISSHNPLRDADGEPHDNVDWALIEISNPIYHGMNGVVSDDGKRSWLAFSSFRNYPPRGSILTTTRKGTVRGIGTGSTSSIKLLGSSRNRDVWSIQTERGLDPGDSGAWVVDAATGDIYGALVAGSATMQEGYVIPASDIIDDIQRYTKARELRLPTMNDVLCLASRYGNLNLIKSLLAAGVVINERPGSPESSTALSEAAQYEQVEVMQVLVSGGAKFNKVSGQEHGRTAVLAASRSGNHHLVKDLISAGALPGSSLSFPNITSKVKRQAHIHVFDSKFMDPCRTQVFPLTAKALDKVQKSPTTQLDRWARNPEFHEKFAIGIKTGRSIKVTVDSIMTLEMRFERGWFDTKQVELASPSAIVSH